MFSFDFNDDNDTIAPSKTSKKRPFAELDDNDDDKNNDNDGDDDNHASSASSKQYTVEIVDSTLLCVTIFFCSNNEPRVFLFASLFASSENRWRENWEAEQAPASTSRVARQRRSASNLIDVS